MSHLQKVIFMNAGDFDFFEVHTDKPIAVSGPNGVGKSTVLRAILFFYAGDSRKSLYGLDAGKKDLPGYLFDQSPSYVVYEVAREGGADPYHVAVFRWNGRIRFLFADVPFRKELFANEGRLLHADELRKNYLRESIRTLDVDSYNRYIQILTGNERSAYSLFTHGDVDRHQMLAKIISGIFTVGRLEGDEFKRILQMGNAESTETDGFNLIEIQDRLHVFKRQYDVVKAFERAEHKAQKLLEVYDRLEMGETDLTSEIRRYAAFAKAIPQEREGVRRKIAEAEEEKITAEKSFSAETDKLSRDKGVAMEQRGCLEARLKKGEDTKAEYEEKGIREKDRTLEFDLPKKRREKESLDRQIKAFESGHSALTQSKDRELSELEKNRHRAETDTAIKKAAALNELDALKSQIHQLNEENTRRTEGEAERQKIQAETEKGRIDAALKGLRDRKEEARCEPDPKQLVETRKLRNETANRIETTKQKLIQAEADRKQLAKSRDHAREKARWEYDRKHEDAQRKAETAQKKEEKSKRDLAAFDASLIAFYDNHIPAASMLARKALNRNLLLSASDDLDAQIDPSAHGLFGISLQWEKMPALQEQLNRDDLTQQIEAAKAEREATLREWEEWKAAFHKEESQAIKAFEDQRSKYDQSIADLQKTNRELSEQFEQFGEQCDEMERKWKAGKEARIAELSEKIGGKEIELKGKNAEIQELTRDLKNRKEALKSEREDKLRDVQEAHEARLKVLEEELRRVLEQINKDRRDVEHRFHEALKSQGLDTKELESMKRRRDTLVQESEAIEKTREEVKKYLDLFNEYVKPLEDTRRDLHLIIKRVESLEGNIQDLKRNEKEKLACINKQLEQLRIRERRIGSDADSTENFKTNPFLSRYAGILSDESIAPAAEYAPGGLKDAFNRIENTARENRGWDEQGSHLGSDFISQIPFESEEPRNILGFTRKTVTWNWRAFVATELRDFILNNKIATFGEQLTKDVGSLVSIVDAGVNSLKDALKGVHSVGAKVSRNIAKNNFVEILTDVQMRVADQLPDIFQELEKAGEFKDLSFGPEANLFSRQAQSREIEAAVRYLDRLSSKMARFGSEKIELTDCYQLEFKMCENGRSTDWLPFISHVGSNGTDYLLKLIVYLGMIEVVHGSHGKGNASAVHCVLDETGTLAPRYLRAAVEYAEGHNIILVSAGINPGGAAYHRQYALARRGSAKRVEGKQVVRKEFSFNPTPKPLLANDAR